MPFLLPTGGSDRGAVFLGVTILVEGRPRRGMRPVS